MLKKFLTKLLPKDILIKIYPDMFPGAGWYRYTRSTQPLAPEQPVNIDGPYKTAEAALAPYENYRLYFFSYWTEFHYSDPRE